MISLPMPGQAKIDSVTTAKAIVGLELGMGKLIIDSIQRLDRPVIVAYLCIIVFMFVIINLVVDILYSVLDPRVRLSEARG